MSDLMRNSAPLCLHSTGKPSSIAKAFQTSLRRSEAVWQKWLNKNKERDAVRRKKLIRLLWFILALVFVGAVGRWLTVSKYRAATLNEEQGAVLLWKIATQMIEVRTKPSWNELVW